MTTITAEREKFKHLTRTEKKVLLAFGERAAKGRVLAARAGVSEKRAIDICWELLGLGFVWPIQAPKSQDEQSLEWKLTTAGELLFSEAKRK